MAGHRVTEPAFLYRNSTLYQASDFIDSLTTSATPSLSLDCARARTDLRGGSAKAARVEGGA